MLEPMQIFIFIIGSAVVIFGAYFATYLVASGGKKMYKGRAIRVLDRFSLSKDKSVAVLAVYDKVYLVAFANSAVTLLDTLDREAAQRAAAEAVPASPLSWGQSFATVLAGKIKKDRREQEDQGSAFLDDAHFEEDILK